MNAPITRVQAFWPAAPGNNATIVMLATHPKLASSLVGTAAGAKRVMFALDGTELGVPANSLQAVEIIWLENNQASAANAIRVYTLLKDGVTWREVDVKDDNGVPQIGSGAPQSVPVLATPAERRILIDVARYNGVAIEYTAGATGPTETTGWNGQILLHINAESIVR
jgi:hypothetical protein